MEIQIPQIIFQMVNFGVVFGALTYLLYKPVLKILEERSNKIHQAQQEAEATIKEKAELEELKKKIKKEADVEAAQIIDEARKNAEAQVETLLADAKNKAKKEIAQMQASFDDEKKKQAEDMRKEFNAAVLKVSAKIMGKSFDQKTHEKIITQELQSILKTM
jgi:F-type H+-transporting ATPase subunit b